MQIRSAPDADADADAGRGSLSHTLTSSLTTTARLDDARGLEVDPSVSQDSGRRSPLCRAPTGDPGGLAGSTRNPTARLTGRDFSQGYNMAAQDLRNARYSSKCETALPLNLEHTSPALYKQSKHQVRHNSREHAAAESPQAKAGRDRRGPAGPLR